MIFLLLLLLAAPAIGQPIDEMCAACHSEQVEDFKTHPHAAKLLSCDACHGMSEKHREATGAAPPDRIAAPHEVPALCGTCHSPAQKAYAQSMHAKLVAERSKTRAAHCGTCHGVHALRTVAAMEAQCRRCHEKLSPENHPATAGATSTTKLSCTNCHDKHTLATKK